MKNIVSMKRFIDDGVGLHCMNQNAFKKWKMEVSKRVSDKGLSIKKTDWSEPKEKHKMINFLDINLHLTQREHSKRICTGSPLMLVLI